MPKAQKRNIFFSAILLMLAGAIQPAPASEATTATAPDLPRTYIYRDMAASLDAFREREFFEAMHRMAHTETTPHEKFVLGVLYHHGLGTEQDMEKARLWYCRASEDGYWYPELGNEAAQALLEMEKNGETKTTSGTKLYQFESEGLQANAEEQLEIAERFFFGLCAPLDYDKAMEWELRAAGNGSIEAMRIAANSYAFGENAYPADPKKAAFWRKKLSGDSKPAATFPDTANPESIAPVPAAPVKPLVLDEEFFKASRPLSEYAAEIYEEGRRHYDGDDGKKNYFLAGLRFGEAAAFGTTEPENYFRLGLIQEQGLCGIPNLFAAAKHYRIAAELGHAEAARRLAHMHETGTGVRKSLAEALRLYAQAHDGGNAEAKADFKRISAAMRPGHREDWEDCPDFAAIMKAARVRARIFDFF